MISHSILLAVLASSTLAVIQQDDYEQTNDFVGNNTITTEQIFKSPCSEGDKFGCLKAAMASLMPTLAIPRRMVIWPGVAVATGGFELDPPPGEGTKVDGYLARGIRAFLTSLSLHVKVLDSDVGQRLTKFSRLFTNAEDSRVNTGRRKKVNNALMLGALLSGGTLFAMGMAAISAMAGKALMVSLLSLGMTMMSRNGGGGKGGGNGGGGETTYEIIHTVPSHHDDYTHRNWADEGYQVVKTH